MSEEFAREADSGHETRKPDTTAGQEQGEEAVLTPDSKKGVGTALVWLSILVIFAAGLAAYSNSFSIPFIEGPIPRSEGEPGVSTSQFESGAADAIWNNTRCPLPALTFALNQRIDPNSPVGFHALNLAMHILTAVMVYLLCRRVFGGRLKEAVAMLAGLLFVVHPANTESVDFIVMRAGLLATCFTTLSVLLFLRATQDETHVKIGALCGSLLAFLCAWASKETAVVLPVLVLAADWVVHERMDRGQRLRIHGAYWALLGAMLVAYFASGAPERTHSTTTGSFGAQAAAILTYLELSVSGRGLSLVHSTPAFSGAFDPATLIAIGVVAVIAVLGLSLLWNRSILGFALLWYLLALMPSSVFDSQDPVLCERRLYPALVGAALALPWLFDRVLNVRLTKAAGGFAAVLVVLAAGAGTYIRNSVWNDAPALWSGAVKAAPDSAYGHQQLGIACLDRGMRIVDAFMRSRQEGGGPSRSVEESRAKEYFADAEEQFREADRLQPDNPKTVSLLGTSIEYQGKADEAIDTLSHALRLDPGHMESALHTAALLQTRAAQKGNISDLARAVDYFKHADQLGTVPPTFLREYALAQIALGNCEEGERLLARAVGGDSSSPYKAELDEIRRVVAQLGTIAKEREDLEKRDPQNPEILKLRGQELASHRHYLQASYALEQFLAGRPDDLGAWVLLGCAKAGMGAANNFLSEWPTPPAAPEGRPSGWVQLAQMCAITGRWDWAETYLESKAASSQVSMPLVCLAETALALAQPAMGYEYLRKATEEYPSEALPWLHLFDLAFAKQDTTAARGYLAEAEKRGVDAVELEARKKRIEDAGAKETEQPMTVLR